jgi:hypothetical protein
MKDFYIRFTLLFLLVVGALAINQALINKYKTHEAEVEKLRSHIVVLENRLQSQEPRIIKEVVEKPVIKTVTVEVPVYKTVIVEKNVCLPRPRR